MLEALLGAGGGILTGLLGTGIQAGFKWLGDRQQHSHDQAMRKLDIEAMSVEHTLALQRTEAEFAGQERVERVKLEQAEAAADAEIRSASYEADRATYWTPKANGWTGIFLAAVDVFRGLMRPGITLYLLVVMTVIAQGLWQVNTFSDQAEAVELYQRIVLELMFLTSTAVTWWFGSRALTRKAA